MPACIKCTETAAVCLNKKDRYCRECFDRYVTHRFRSTLAKQHVLLNGDRVLLCYSGGACSTALLNLVKRGFSVDSRRRVTIDPIVLVILEPNSHIDDILSVLGSVGLPVYFTSIERVFSTDQALITLDDLRKNQLSSVDFSCERWNNLFSAIKPSSSRRQLRSRLFKHLILMTANELNIDKIFVGDCMTSLGADLITRLTYGHGAQLHDDCAILDKRNYHDCTGSWTGTLLRPMSELTSKEIALYNHMNKLECVSDSDKADSDSLFKPAIQDISKNFVSGLQVNFPATVSTIFSCANKTKGNEEILSELKCDHCSLCFSSISEITNDSGDNVENSVLDRFCYGCKVVIKDVPDFSLLPPCVLVTCGR